MESLLYLKLLTPPPANCGERMPAKLDGKAAPPLYDEGIASIRKWIEDGAKEQ